MSLKLSTIDIDDTSKKFLLRVLGKICRCKHLQKISWKASLNGWHIFLWCDKKCDVCRLVFDDVNRFRWDLERPEFSRNVMFDVKVPVKLMRIPRADKGCALSVGGNLFIGSKKRNRIGLMRVYSW